MRKNIILAFAALIAVNAANAQLLVNDDGKVHLVSRSFDGDVDFDIDSPSQIKEQHWGDYARGAKYALRKRFELNKGIYDKLHQRWNRRRDQNFV